MKKALTLFSIGLMFFSFNQLGAHEGPLTGEKFAEIKNQVVLPFLEALKNGDTKLLKQLMSKDMYRAKRVLLEQNDAYPEFLKNLYTDATFQVGEVKEQDGDIIVHVRINFPDGRQRNIKLHLQLVESWKVTDNIE
jgi:hypothetical protein